MTANSDRTGPAHIDGGNRPSGEPCGEPEVVRHPGLGRNIRLTGIFLIVSAFVFCMLVVRQRDATRRELNLKWAENIQVQLQKILDERKFLPRSLPTDLDVNPETLKIPYPSPDAVSRLEIQDQPFVLIAGPPKGLIMPGGDGCAVVLFDAGRVSAEWMTITEVEAALERRRKLASGPATSD